MTEYPASDNTYISQPIGSVYVKTAMPIILMMLVNGSLNLVDAYFIGVFVGADALAAVTAVFPLFMLMVAFTTWIATGFASVMARLLGARQVEEAREAFAQAITLSLILSLILIALFMLTGQWICSEINAGNVHLTAMSYQYMMIIFVGSPLMFMLSISGDSLRSEGHAGFMALISLATTLFNGILNYVLIVWLDMGVSGSALGTVAAQWVALLIVWLFRRGKSNRFGIPAIAFTTAKTKWRDFMALGAPSSLTYIGVAITSTTILITLQQWQPVDYALTVSAYGVITRLMTFAFMPLLGLGMAMQSIVGNNVGAGLYQRANSGIRLALNIAFGYGLLLVMLFWLNKESLGEVFVSDQRVVAEVARILPITSLSLILFGPLMMVSFFFQSIGDAKRSALLSITKTYLFSLPLILSLPYLFGESGIWFANPVTECCALVLTMLVLFNRSRLGNYRLGLFYKIERGPA